MGISSLLGYMNHNSNHDQINKELLCGKAAIIISLTTVKSLI